MKPMARYLCFLAIVLALGFAAIVGCARLFGAQEKAVLDSPRLVSFNALPLYDDASGALLSLTVNFTYKVPMLLPDGKSLRPHIRVEKADFVLQGGQLVAIGDQLVEFGDLAEDIIAVADFVWRLNNPNPLPTNPAPALERRKKVPQAKRKAMREPVP